MSLKTVINNREDKTATSLPNLQPIKNTSQTYNSVPASQLDANQLCMAKRSRADSIQCPNKHRPGSRFCGKHANCTTLIDGTNRLYKTPKNSARISDPIAKSTKTVAQTSSNSVMSQAVLMPATAQDYFRDPALSVFSNELVSYSYKYYGLGRYLLYKESDSAMKTRLVNFIKNLADWNLRLDKIKKVQGIIRRRKRLINVYNHGIGAMAPKRLCNNTCDFYSLESIEDIQMRYLFTYMDNDGFCYGFNIHSFIELVNHSNINPYNRAVIPNEVICRARRYLLILNKWALLDTIHAPSHNKNNNNNTNNTNNNNNNNNKNKNKSSSANTNTNDNIVQQPIVLAQLAILSKLPLKTATRLRLTSIFQRIDMLGYHTCINWLYDKSSLILNNYIKALYRNWTFQAGICEEYKELILADTHAFYELTDEAYKGTLVTLNKYRLLSRILDVMECMLSDRHVADVQNIASIIIIYSLYYIEPKQVVSSNPWIH